MNKTSIHNFFKSVKNTLSKRSPEILVGFGIAGMVTTTVLAVKATPKALYLIDDRKDELEVDKLPAVEVVKTTWKCYAPAFVTGTASAACIILANTVHSKRNAVLATAYKISEKALIEYKDAVIETIGEKKEQAVREKVAEKRLENDPIENHEIIITNDSDNTLCYDGIGGRYFKSSIDKIRKTENKLNRTILKEMYVSLNDFYYEIGLEGTRLGDELGWNMDDGEIEFDLRAKIAEDGTPCIVIDYIVAPHYNFSHFA